MEYLRCNCCGGVYPEVFFQIHRVGVYTRQRRIICRGCLQTQRDKKKWTNRPLEKARLTFRHHARKFIERGIIQHRDELTSVFGWDLKQMAHDIEHASKNGCPYCHQLFLDMEHGLAAITLDIVRPEELPYYTTNVRWVCRTCNTEKQRTPAEQWGATCQAWKGWRELQSRLQRDQYAGTMFEGVRALHGCN